MYRKSRIASTVTDYHEKSSLASQLRTKRIEPFLRLVAGLSASKKPIRIIDIGGTKPYWNILPDSFMERHDLRITIVNLPGSEIQPEHGRFRFVEGDACDLSAFDTNTFDIAHSNSVVEHVGDWSRMVAFAAEVKRVAKHYFVQTPNYWFPIEPHCLAPFFHWLPMPLRIRLVQNFRLGHWSKAASVDEAVRSVESARLLNRKMFCELFPEATVLTERIVALPKSFVAIA